MNVASGFRAWLGRVRDDASPLTSRQRASLRQALGASLWVADRAQLEGQTLSVSGWIISPTDSHNDVALMINTRRFDIAELGTSRPDLEAVFRFVPGIAHAGFAA